MGGRGMGWGRGWWGWRRVKGSHDLPLDLYMEVGIQSNFLKLKGNYGHGGGGTQSRSFKVLVADIHLSPHATAFTA